MAFTTGSRCSSLREQMATSAPALANSSAMDLPMPVPPPVTIAVFPSRENGDFAMAGTIPQGAGAVYSGSNGLWLELTRGRWAGTLQTGYDLPRIRAPTIRRRRLRLPVCREVVSSVLGTDRHGACGPRS